jgi:hypothetical protein
MSLRSRLCNISRYSWHYRLVAYFYDDKGPVINSACHYWCAIVPGCLLITVFGSLIALTLGGALIWVLGDLAIWSFHHPLKLVLYALLEIGLCVGVIGLCVGLVVLGERIKQRCPSLNIK